ncbi:DUF4019 domain-containing protein [Thalassotalea montiporae]
MRKFIFILMLSLSLAASAFANEEASAGINAGKDWLQLIDTGQYSQSWQQADELFKSQLSATKWQQALNSVRAPLGKVLLREPYSKQSHRALPGAPDGDYLVVTFQTQFEHKAKAIETLTLTKSSGDWRAIGYFIK